ncbi:MAG: type II secretion system protein [Christensenellaceae bacterium]
MIVKAMMKKKQNKKAFTLVELIVVIAIIGVLMAILIPSMMGFVTQAETATANANARTVYSAAAAQGALMKTQGTAVTGEQTSAGAGEATFITAMKALLGDNFTEGGATWSVSMTDNKPTKATWVQGTKNGAYPVAAPTPTPAP